MRLKKLLCQFYAIPSSLLFVLLTVSLMLGPTLAASNRSRVQNNSSRNNRGKQTGGREKQLTASYQVSPAKRNNASTNAFGFGFIPLTADSPTSAQRICIELEAFRCHSSDDVRETECIESYLTCDNRPHCDDGSDEWCDNGLEACVCLGGEFCSPLDHKCHQNDNPMAIAPRTTQKASPVIIVDDSPSSEIDALKEDDEDDFGETLISSKKSVNFASSPTVAAAAITFHRHNYHNCCFPVLLLVILAKFVSF